MKLRFEKAGKKNTKEILELYNWYVLNSDVSFHIEQLSPNEMQNIIFFQDTRFQTFIIKCDVKFCGYVILSEYKKREAYNITGEISIYLKDEYTGNSIGEKSLKFIENFARKNNFHSVLGTVSGTNERSIKLFEKNGYTKCSHFKEVGKKFNKLIDVLSFQKLL